MERDDAGAEAARACLVADALDQRLVTAVHAIEHTQRDRVVTGGNSMAQFVANEEHSGPFEKRGTFREVPAGGS